MAQKQHFKVVGSNTMHCAGCETGIQFTLTPLPGVKTVHADYKTQLIEITVEETVLDPEKVRSELDWLGHEVEVVS